MTWLSWDYITCVAFHRFWLALSWHRDVIEYVEGGITHNIWTSCSWLPDFSLFRVFCFIGLKALFPLLLLLQVTFTYVTWSLLCNQLLKCPWSDSPSPIWLQIYLEGAMFDHICLSFGNLVRAFGKWGCRCCIYCCLGRLGLIQQVLARLWTVWYLSLNYSCEVAHLICGFEWLQRPFQSLRNFGHIEKSPTVVTFLGICCSIWALYRIHTAVDEFGLLEFHVPRSSFFVIPLSI